MSEYYPAFLDLRERDCLVVGTSELARSKAEALRCAGAKVRHVAVFDPDLARDIFLIVADVPDGEARIIAGFAEQERIFLNVVDKPRLCSFILPAILERGDLQIAISTSGSSPALAGWIRRGLEGLFGPEYTRLLSVLRRTRQEIQHLLPGYEARKKFYYSLFEEDILATAQKGGEEAVELQIRRSLEEVRA